jgi:predicted RNase H-like HicB family nuclease
MYRVWYWALIDRESDGRFIASIPDLDDLAAYGHTDKDAVAHVTELAGQRVRAAVEEGQPVPPRRQSSEMPSQIRSKEVGRAIIPVEVGRREAWPTPPYHMSPWARLPAMETPFSRKSGSALTNRSSGRRGGGRRGAMAHKHAANMRALALSAVIQKIRAAGFISYNAVARELNRLQVPTLRHGKQWYPTTVSRLLVRLSKMRSPTLAQHGRHWRHGGRADKCGEESRDHRDAKAHRQARVYKLTQIALTAAMKQQQLIEEQMAAFLASAPDLARELARWHGEDAKT